MSVCILTINRNVVSIILSNWNMRDKTLTFRLFTEYWFPLLSLAFEKMSDFFCIFIKNSYNILSSIYNKLHLDKKVIESATDSCFYNSKRRRFRGSCYQFRDEIFKGGRRTLFYTMDFTELGRACSPFRPPLIYNTLSCIWETPNQDP